MSRSCELRGKGNPFRVFLWMGLIFFGYAALINGISLSSLVALPSDDAFYYFKIARNIVLGNGITFDGVSLTNGFHPLWMLLILPVFWLFPGSLEIPVRLILMLNGLLCLTTLYLLYRLVRRYISFSFAVVGLCACLLPYLLTSMINGMETGILLLSLTVFLWFCFETRIYEAGSPPRFFFICGFLLGIVVLCRLDSFFLVPASLLSFTATAISSKTRLSRFIFRILLFGIGFAILFVLYLAWNYLYFDHLMPISGSVKSTFPKVVAYFSFHEDLAFGTGLMVLLFIMNFILAVNERHKGVWPRRMIQSPLSVLTLGCLFHYLYAFLFMAWGVNWWHFTLYGFTFSILLARVLDQLTVRVPHYRPRLVAAVVIVLLVAATTLKGLELLVKYHQHREWLAGAQWARQNTAPETVFAIKDAGLFSYFSDRPVINLDGKANGFEYRNYLAAQRPQDYLAKVKVDYIADVNTRYTDGQYSIHIPCFDQPDIIFYMPEAKEVFRSKRAVFPALGRYRTFSTCFSIWKVPEPLSKIANAAR